MENTTSIINKSYNYLETPLIESFFILKERKYYFDSLKHVGTRREFYDTYKNSITKFISCINSDKDISLLNSIAFNHIKTIIDENTFKVPLSSIDPKGFHLLNLSEPVSIDSLKDKYRIAAKKYHPDIGGTNEEMQTVNSAFDKFHNILCIKTFNNDEDCNSDFLNDEMTAKDFIYLIYTSLIEITLDDWQIEESYKWLKLFYERNIANTKYGKGLLTSSIPMLSNLAKNLHLIKLTTESQYCFTKAEECLAIAQKEGLFYDNYVKSAHEIINELKKPRIVITHIKQANNLLYYNIIDEKKYNDAMKRFNIRKNDDESKEDILKIFLLENEFQNLPLDILTVQVNITGKLINEPDYFDYYFNELTDEQKCEYKEAFSKSTNIKLIRKYVYVRLFSILKSIISFENQKIIKEVIKEVKFFKEIKAHRSSLDSECDSLLSLLFFFSELSESDFKERMNLLNKLDSNAAELEIDKNSVIVFWNRLSSKLTIKLNPSYYEFAKLPTEKFKKILSEGIITCEEEKKNNEIWNDELSLIESIRSKHGEMELFKVLDIGKENPSVVIEKLEPYVNDLLLLGEKITNVQELQVMFWIDKLTINMVRLKDFKNAVNLFEKAFLLSEKYWERSNNTEKNSILKRYEKCLKELNK
ncbi:MAG TPA: J domain-containing protein [Ignavibacteria bacterium]|nr:J domain-containing protein [Ignavibacteria bacterium]